MLYGEEGNDSLVGGLGNDRLFGEDDSDIFPWAAGDGNDTVEGGTGQDAQILTGLAAASNRFNLASADALANRVVASWDDFGAGTGSVDMAAVEHASLVGGYAAGPVHGPDSGRHRHDPGRP